MDAGPPGIGGPAGCWGCGGRPGSMTENVKLPGENAGVLLKCVSGRMRNFESRIGLTDGAEE